MVSAPQSTDQGTVHANGTTAIQCDSCDEWNQPREPFKLHGNTYYVGTKGLSSVLITSPNGHILLDGALPQSASLIDNNIRKLGFRTQDIRLIVNSHAHYDHAGGIAALQKLSGARVAASEDGARALAKGEPTEHDPQYESGHEPSVRFPPVNGVETVTDGQVLSVGPISITAHYTPGHTVGSTTWTWTSCEASNCLNIVYADSLNPVSDDGFRFTGDTKHKDVTQSFAHSIATVDRLPCDIIVTVHPDFMGIDEKLAARARSEPKNPFVDPNSCRQYAKNAANKLSSRVAEEKKATLAH